MQGNNIVLVECIEPGLKLGKSLIKAGLKVCEPLVHAIDSVIDSCNCENDVDLSKGKDCHYQGGYGYQKGF